jgi:hypothetical protein
MDRNFSLAVDAGQSSQKPQGVVESPYRDGATYRHERYGKRLHRQHNRVLAFMRDGQWHSLSAIAEATGDPEASVSARLRDLRKPRFGSYQVERRYVERGLFEYRVPVQLELV